jgi:DNA mismatch endonuclease, patch repair protein
MTARVKKRDPLTPEQRSIQMGKVRARKNRSTEMHVAAHLIARGFRGWKRHVASLPGCPDFYFVEQRVALFVDGCFWHGCPKCKRNIPHARRTFWCEKIESNRVRDKKVARVLRAQDYTVIRIWEHDLSNCKWIEKVQSALQRFHQRRDNSFS